MLSQASLKQGKPLCCLLHPLVHIFHQTIVQRWNPICLSSINRGIPASSKLHQNCIDNTLISSSKISWCLSFLAKGSSFHFPTVSLTKFSHYTSFHSHYLNYCLINILLFWYLSLFVILKYILEWMLSKKNSQTLAFCLFSIVSWWSCWTIISG